MLCAHGRMGEEVLGVRGTTAEEGKNKGKKKREDEGSDACSWLIMKLWVVS